MAAFAGTLAPLDPEAQDLGDRLAPPFWSEAGTISQPLGTDQLGRDVFSRLVEGSRVSVFISLLVVSLSFATGGSIGLLAGYIGGKIESVLMTIVDATMAFPGLLIALIIVLVLGPSFTSVALALLFRGWVIYARLARGAALSLREAPFVDAARAVGASDIRLMARHVLPNALPSLLAIAPLEVGRVILAESALSFLGLGIQPPEISWGLMIADGRSYIASANWLVMAPGATIFLTVLSAILLGNAVGHFADPLQRRL